MEDRQVQTGCLPVVHGKLIHGQPFAWNIALGRICIDLGHSVDLLEGEVCKEHGIEGQFVTFLPRGAQAQAIAWVKGGPLPMMKSIEA